MKHLKQVVILALLVVGVSAIGFAGKGSRANVPSSGSTLQQTGVITIDGRDEAVVKSSKGRQAHVDAMRNFSQATPEPRKEAPSPLLSATSGLPAGTYHIPGDFSSIGSAVAVINFVGLAGNVVLQLDAASYTENTVTFGNYAGAATYSVTIKPNAGVAATVLFVTDATHGKGFAFNQGSNVTIDGLNTGGSSLTLKYATGYPFPAGDAFAATVYVTNGSSNITVQNASIEGEITTAGAWVDQTDGRPAVFVWRGASDAKNTNITITHCTITNATYAAKVLNTPTGNTNGIINYTYNNVGLAFGQWVGHGGVYDQIDVMHYDHNVVNGVLFIPFYWTDGGTEYDVLATFATSGGFMLNFGQQSGGHLYNCLTGSTLSYNVVKNIYQHYSDGFAFIAYGLLARVGGSVSVHDNRIDSVYTDEIGGTIAGLRTESGGFHNSIRLEGTMVPSQVSYCMRAAGGNIYNNAFSNEMTGGTAANTRCLQGTPAGASDGNAMFSNGRISTNATLNSYLTGGLDAHSVFGPIGFDNTLHLGTFPSAAENIGLPHISVAADIDGTVRDTTNAGTRDAGADEVTASSGLPTALDILPTVISSPNPAGVPAGLAVPVVVVVKNNSNQVVTGATVAVTITDGYTSGAVAVPSIPSNSSVTVTLPNWTPPTGSWTIAATTTLAGDVNAGNDLFSRAQSVQAPVLIPAASDTTYTWNASDQGWTRTADFIRTSAFTKLGGPVSGAAMVTVNSLKPQTYTEGAYANTQGYSATYPGPNLLISPWFDLHLLTTDVYVSFQHSINVEPGWDGSWVEYTTDGLNWHHLGTLNAANGINWYSQAVYANALSESGDPLDTVTMKRPEYKLYGPGTSNLTIPISWWSSNGNPAGPTDVNPVEDGPLGPNGWIFTQLHMTPATNPDIVGAPLVKFRYIAFSDAATAYEGWAVDNFHVGAHGATFTGDTISGQYFTDVNGNKVNDDASPLASKKVYLSYFGVLKDSTTTDGTGNFQFLTAVSNGGLPGVYQLTVALPAGFAYDYPATNVLPSVNAAGASAHIVSDIGIYSGGVTGFVYNDLNSNGTKNVGEPGLLNWTVEVRKDSCTGALVTTGLSDATGAYSIALAPGTYYFDEVLKAGFRLTTVNCGSAVVTGPSGSPQTVGANFGDFKFGLLRVETTVDANGNGIDDGPGDHTPLPVGAPVIFDVTKNGVHLLYDTLGNGVAVKNHTIDTGAYVVTLISEPANWYVSAFHGTSFTVTSGLNDTALFLQFKIFSVSGSKFEDLNGNGVQDGGEPALPGFTVSLSGTLKGGGTAVTDSLGNWSIDSVGGGVHVISETVPAGWTETFPALGTYTFTGNAFTGDVTGKVFGNFRNVSVTGLTYRDRNNNGTHNAGEEGLAGVNMTITGTGGGTLPTDANGVYTFTNLGPGAHTITQTVAGGYVQTEPVTPGYTFTAASHSNLTGVNFGSFQSTDGTQKFVTFGSDWWVHFGINYKPLKAPKAGKPYFPPNDANLVAYLFAGGNPGGTVKVGLSGQLNLGNKEKAYILPKAYTDVAKTFYTKGVEHSDVIFRGLDFGNTGKQLLKLYKSMPPTTQNNDCVEDMLGLALNLALSNAGITPAGLGLLKYYDPTDALFNGKSVAEIKVYGDTLMTNYEFHTKAEYTHLSDVVGKINNAFFCDSADCEAYHAFLYDSLAWIGAGNHVILKAGQGFPVTDCSYLRPATGVTPVITPIVPLALPKVYALYQNYPNPFNPTTSIDFDLPEAANVTLKVYNLLGQEVATLLNHQTMDAGNTSMDFDASKLASGVYLYRIVAEKLNDDGSLASHSFTQVKKMVLVK